MKSSYVIKLVALLIIMIIGNNSPSFSQKPEQLFQKGLVKEEGEGSLQEAIDIYNKVVDDVSAARSLRANALLHVGFCYEKLGQEKARETYKKLISDFADQEDIVAIGKKKLSYLDAKIKVTKSDGLIIRQVWSPAEDTYGVSPDGRYLNYIDWNAIALAVKDIKTGKTWNLTHTGTWKAPWQFPDNSIWAPDSKQIAYYWFNGDTTELHIINLDGTGDRVICNGVGDNTPWPFAWTSDGKYILAIISSVNENNPDEMVDQIVLVAAADGSIRVLKSFDGINCGCSGSVSPDNQYIAYALQQEEGSELKDIFLYGINDEKEIRVVSGPGDDWNALWSHDGSRIVFLSDRLGTTDLWTLQLDNGVPAGEPELIKSNLGERTHLIGITDDNALYYDNMNMRSDVLIARLDFNSGKILSETNRISSIEEDRNIKPIWSPDGRYVAYMVVPSYRDNVLGYKYDFIIYDNQTQSSRKLDADLYGTGRSYWSQPRWSPDGKYLLVQGRTDKDKLQGFFLVDINTGERISILVKEREPKSTAQPIGIFPLLSGDGKDIFYLTSDRKAIVSRNITTKQERKVYAGEDQILQFSLSPDGSQIVFGYFCCKPNALYTVPATGGEKRILVETQEEITPYFIAWTPDNKHVIFEVGAYESKEPHEILRVPVNGGNPERVLLLDDLFSQGLIWNIEVHPDGQQVVMDVKTGHDTEIWVMENLFKK